jgi:hypothetical protein
VLSSLSPEKSSLRLDMIRSRAHLIPVPGRILDGKNDGLDMRKDRRGEVSPSPSCVKYPTRHSPRPKGLLEASPLDARNVRLSSDAGGRTPGLLAPSWKGMFLSAKRSVGWGQKHRVRQRVRSVGMDENHWGCGKSGDAVVMVICQNDDGMRHPFWVDPRRRESILRAVLDSLSSREIAG